MFKNAFKHLLAMSCCLLLAGCASTPPAHLVDFQQKAEAGDVVSQRKLGLAYDGGTMGVRKNYAAAARWYQLAADQGDAISQNNLGSLYEHGLGVPRDYRKAAGYYRKSSDQGFAMAQNSLGRLYDYGNGVPQSYIESNAWFRRAAEQGDAQAMYNLGVNYALGQGVKEDRVETCKWETLAERFGRNTVDRKSMDGILDALNTCHAYLTPEQIAEGQRRANAWQEQHSLKPK